MTGKVYSRKKVAIPKLIQVQEFEPAFENEVTVSHPSLQTQSILQSKISIDQISLLPSGIEQGNALNALCIHFPMLCHSKSLHPIRVF